MKKAFGWNIKSWIKAEKHWYSNGAKEGRNFACDQEGFLCADGENANCACNAGSQIIYALKHNNGFNPGTGQKTSFRSAVRYGHSVFEVYSSNTKCTNSLFGDPQRGRYKKCFCEPKQNLPPIQIAEEGVENIIPKVKDRYVYYGRLEAGKGTLSFKEMVREPF